MVDEVRNPEATIDADEQAADRHTLDETIAKTAQYAQTGDQIDPGMGQMGGAGASGAAGPDIAKQSVPVEVNPADRPAGER
jgi:hypothetical protein